MTTEKSPAQIESESKAAKAAFGRVWAETLNPACTALASLPKTALAYEIAWKAFLAGRNSNAH